MNIAQLSEQLKDVPQNRLIDYARNPNSVVPQFLALAEIQRRQQLQTQAQPPQSTVANDVLAQATTPQVDPAMMQGMPQQLPENQPGVAQLPTGMGQGFAPGGLVAFSGEDGSLVDEDEAYQAYLEKAESKKRRSALSEMASGLTSRIAGVGDQIAALPAKAKEAIASLPQSYEAAKKTASSAIQATGDEVQDFLAKIQHLESRGKHFDEKGKILTSSKGAEGIMQVMPKTQRSPGYGVTPARDKSPEELKRVGDEYGIAMLREFGDPKLAAMAYNWGPGNVKKWLASGQKTPVPAETRKYASHFAKGGIAHFYAGGNQNLGLSPGESVINPITMSELDSAYEDEDKFRSQVVEPPKPVNPFVRYMDMLREEQSGVSKQAQEDKYSAILQAGLGMLSGSSPYAFQNIGAGGIQGLAAYGASKKQRAAELNALRKMELGALEAQHLYDYRQQQIEDARRKQEENLEFKYEKLSQADKIAAEEAERKRDALIARGRADAAKDKNYIGFEKQLALIPEDSTDPKDIAMRKHILAKMEAITESYIATAQKGKYVAPQYPNYEAPPEEPGFWSKVGSKLSGLYGGGSNPNVVDFSQLPKTK